MATAARTETAVQEEPKPKGRKKTADKPGPQASPVIEVAPVAPIVPANGNGMSVPEWERNAELKKALKEVYAPRATDEQFLVFLNECKRRNAIPGKHIHFRLQRQREKKILPSGAWTEDWIEKPIFITSIDFFRLIAQRTGQYAGQKRLAWYYLDEQKQPSIRREIPDAQLRPYAAEATVLRHDFAEPMVRIARYAAFVQTYKKNDEEIPNQMWQRMGPEQTAKCAEAQALRAAFPEELGGLYISEEIPYEPQEQDAPAAVQIDTSAATPKVSTGPLTASQHQPDSNKDSGQRQNATERAQTQTQAAPVQAASPAECAPVAVSSSEVVNDGTQGVPRADLPDPAKVMTPSGPQGSLSMNSDASAVPKDEAQPTNGAVASEAQPAAPKFGARLRALAETVFGMKCPSDTLIQYLFFALPPVVTADIEVGGRWNQEKWNAAMKAMLDRAERLELMETVLADQGRDGFLPWAKALVATAKAKKVFVSK